MVSVPELKMPPPKSPRVAAESAVGDGQCCASPIEDATAEAALAVPDRQTGNRDRFTCADLEDTAGGIAVNGENISAGAVDCHALVDQQLRG